MKNNKKTVQELAQILKERGFGVGRIHSSPIIKNHYIELSDGGGSAEKAIDVAHETGFDKAYKAGDKNRRVGFPNPAFKPAVKKAVKKVAKPVVKKAAPKKVAKKKPAANKAVRKKARRPSDKIPVQAEILIGLISGIPAPNVRYRVVEAIIREMSEVSMKSMLRKLGYCSSLKKSGNTDLSKVSEAALKRELSNRWKKK